MILKIDLSIGGGRFLRSISHKEDMGNKVGEYLKYLTGGFIHQNKYLAISVNQV